MNGQNRSDVKTGQTVNIVLKADQRTGTLTKGTVMKILTNSANHRTIPSNIKELLDYKIDIVMVKSTQNQYFIGDRQFELPEIKLLIDVGFILEINHVQKKQVTHKQADGIRK